MRIHREERVLDKRGVATQMHVAIILYRSIQKMRHIKSGRARHYGDFIFTKHNYHLTTLLFMSVHSGFILRYTLGFPLSGERLSESGSLPEP